MSDATPDGPPPGPPSWPRQPAPPLALYYAGFWWRVLAIGIDWAVLSIASTAISVATGLQHLGFGWTPQQDQGAVSDVDYTVGATAGLPELHAHSVWLTLVMFVLTVAYFVLLESSRWQGTVGKRACRLRVTDAGGRRIGPGRAIGRYFGKFLSTFVLGIGFLMVAWTRRKQGLHDILADTLVMRLRPADLMFGFQPPRAP